MSGLATFLLGDRYNVLRADGVAYVLHRGRLRTIADEPGALQALLVRLLQPTTRRTEGP